MQAWFLNAFLTADSGWEKLLLSFGDICIVVYVEGKLVTHLVTRSGPVRTSLALLELPSCNVVPSFLHFGSPPWP